MIGFVEHRGGARRTYMPFSIFHQSSLKWKIHREGGQTPGKIFCLTRRGELGNEKGFQPFGFSDNFENFERRYFVEESLSGEGEQPMF